MAPDLDLDLELDTYQQLLLVRLALSPDGGEFLKDLEVGSLPASRRKALAAAGLSEEIRRKSPSGQRPATYLRLTAAGRQWCHDHLAAGTLSLGNPPPGILKAVAVLLAERLGERLPNAEDPCSLRDWVVRRLGNPLPGSPFRQVGADRGLPLTAEPLADLVVVVRGACLQLAGGRTNVRVRLAELRDLLASVGRAELDQALLAMQKEGELSLYRLDNPREIDDADRRAVLHTPAGAERHILYYGGAGA